MNAVMKDILVDICIGVPSRALQNEQRTVSFLHPKSV